jgi:hypothetical protein
LCVALLSDPTFDFAPSLYASFLDSIFTLPPPVNGFGKGTGQDGKKILRKIGYKFKFK